MKIKKNTILGKISITIVYLDLVFNLSTVGSEEKIESKNGSYIEVKILDKLSSKNYNLVIKIGEEKAFKEILIKPLKCKNSEFDDNPEITAYLQVKDIKTKDKNEVFVFNGWTFASSPALRPFDHPIYDIWLTKCII